MLQIYMTQNFKAHTCKIQKIAQIRCREQVSSFCVCGTIQSEAPIRDILSCNRASNIIAIFNVSRLPEKKANVAFSRWYESISN